MNESTRTLDVSRYLENMKDTTVVHETEILGATPTNWKSIPADYEITYVYILHFVGVSHQPLPAWLEAELNNRKYDVNSEKGHIRVKQMQNQSPEQRIGVIEVVISQFIKGSIFDVKSGSVSLDIITSLIENQNNDYVDQLLFRLNRHLQHAGPEGDGLYLINFTRHIRYIQTSGASKQMFYDSEGNLDFSQEISTLPSGNRLVEEFELESGKTTQYEFKTQEDIYADLEGIADEDPYFQTEEIEWEIVPPETIVHEPVKITKPRVEEIEWEIEPTQPVTIQAPQEKSIFEDEQFEEISNIQETQRISQPQEVVVDSKQVQYYVEKPQLGDDINDEFNFEEFKELPQIQYSEPSIQQQPKKQGFGSAIGNAFRKISGFIFRR